MAKWAVISPEDQDDFVEEAAKVLLGRKIQRVMFKGVEFCLFLDNGVTLEVRATRDDGVECEIRDGNSP